MIFNYCYVDFLDTFNHIEMQVTYLQRVARLFLSTRLSDEWLMSDDCWRRIASSHLFLSVQILLALLL